MFFTKAGKFMAWLLVISGGSAVLIGLLARHGGDPTFAADLLKGRPISYLINAGTEWLVMGLALGMLAEIGQSVAASPKGSGGK